MLDNSGTNRALTEDLLMQLEDSVREKGGATLNAYISNLAIIRRYHELLREDTFFAMSSPKAFDGGSGVGRDGGAQQKGKDGGDGRTVYRFSGNPWHAEPYFAVRCRKSSTAPRSSVRPPMQPLRWHGTGRGIC